MKTLQGSWSFKRKFAFERPGLISGMYSSFYGRMPLKLGAAWLWICIQMNTEQIIQSTDPSLRLWRLHPSCSVFTVSPRSKSDPKPSCAFVWAQPIKCARERGTVGSCSVWEEQKRLLCRDKTCKKKKIICIVLIAQLLKFLIDSHAALIDGGKKTGIWYPVHIKALGFVPCLEAGLAQWDSVCCSCSTVYHIFNFWKWYMTTSYQILSWVLITQTFNYWESLLIHAYFWSSYCFLTE